MLNSWFGQKSSNDEIGSPRRSTEPRTLSTKNRPSASTATDPPPQYANPPKPVFTPITTPHDTVLARLSGSAQNSSQHEATPQLETTDDPNSPSVASKTPYPISAPEALKDPFDGSTLGILLPQDSSTDARSNDQMTEAMWTHLSRVLELQGQIATMHMNMEGIRLGKAGDPKSKGMAGSTPSGSTGISGHPPVNPPRFESTLSQLDPSMRRVQGRADEEGVDVPDEEAELNRIREEQFARLADQFEGRKEAINEIMDKLDKVSEALTEFNALQVPKIEFPSSRHDHKSSEPIVPLNEANSSSKTSPPGRTNPSSPNKSNLPSHGILPQSLSRSKPAQSKVPHPLIPSVVVRSPDGSIPHLFDSPFQLSEV